MEGQAEPGVQCSVGRAMSNPTGSGQRKGYDRMCATSLLKCCSREADELSSIPRRSPSVAAQSGFLRATLATCAFHNFETAPSYAGHHELVSNGKPFYLYTSFPSRPHRNAYPQTGTSKANILDEVYN